MRVRTIKDCERDVKGVHDWKVVGVDSASDGNYAIWCHKCGALGYCKQPLPRYIGDYTIFGRVQE